ncbi:MAG: ribonuclease III [Vampirovibrionales bacterium]|nr:ribonuclease III [Vampirovibrionales bacterium]
MHDASSSAQNPEPSAQEALASPDEANPEETYRVYQGPGYNHAREIELYDLLMQIGVLDSPLLEGSQAEKHIDFSLYHQALLHSSYVYEQRLRNEDAYRNRQHAQTENYERLEFLGDAVLKLIVSEYLFERFPEYREGELTKIRAVIISDATLAELAKNVNLGPYIIFGPSEYKSGGPNKTSNLACAFEALLGAMFLDGRMQKARQLLTVWLEDLITRVDLSKTKDNYKAVLQELSQAESGELPYYRTVSESGPSHNRTFRIEVLLHGEVMGVGSGKTKKEAQQQAARMALIALNQLSENE